MSSIYIPESSGDNAKKRRLLKRQKIKEQLESREELVARLGSAPAANRESYFGRYYSGSEEKDWLYYDTIGWIHKREESEFNDSFAQCEVTKRWMNKLHLADIGKPNDEGVHINRWVCPVEAQKLGYFKCAYSTAWFPLDKATEVYSYLTKPEKICIDYLSHYSKCDFTGKLFDHGNLIKITRSEKYKLVNRWSCENGKFVRCYDCKHWFESDAAPMRNHGYHNCENCWEVRQLGNIIMAHNHHEYPKPIYTPKFTYRVSGGEIKKDNHGFPMRVGKSSFSRVEEKSIRLFGWEAETEICKKSASKAGLNRNKLAHAVMKVLGNDYIVIKEDGTLKANEHYSKGTGFSGFEIVSCPADLEAHRARVPNLLNLEGFDGKKTGHFRAWDEYDTCGFHVHVSRDALTPLQIGRMLHFINHKNNAKFIHKVAGRGSDRYCRYLPKGPEDKTHPATDVLYPSERVISKEEENSRDRSRRVALNLCNKKTVEFRIFRGTMHPRHILRNLEFCDAVCDFCYPGNFSFKDMEKPESFIAYVNRNRKKWPLFAEWLVNQKILEMKKLGEKAQLEKLTINPDNAVETTREESAKLPTEIMPIPNPIPKPPTVSFIQQKIVDTSFNSLKGQSSFSTIKKNKELESKILKSMEASASYFEDLGEPPEPLFDPESKPTQGNF